MKKQKTKTKITTKPILFVAVIVFAVAGAGLFALNPAKDSSVGVSYAEGEAFNKLEVGLNWHPGWSNGLYDQDDNEAIIDQMADAGMKWVRIDIGWVNVEEAGDIYGDASDPSAVYTPGSGAANNWYIKKIDNAINYANSKGIKVLGLWWTTPQWARDGGASSTSYQVRPADPNEYAESLSWAMKYWENRIDAWQMWNEADPDQKFWGAPPNASSYGGVQEYANLVKATYPKVKADHPDSTVVLTGASSIDIDFYTDLYDYGIKGNFDVLAAHPYQGPANAGPLDGDGSKRWHFLRIPELRNLMVSRGDADKPMWLTEVGWSVHDNAIVPESQPWNMGVTEQQQADFVVDIIDHAYTNWPYVEAVMFYTDKNHNRTSGDAAFLLHQNNFGFFNTDNTPKPVVGAVKSYVQTNMATSPPVFNIADINGSGKVDIVDLSILLSAWGTNNTASDINNDGKVDIVDLSILLSNWS